MWALILAIALVITLSPSISTTEAASGTLRTITLPIHPDRADDVTWTDTWGAPRGGGRSHIGVDMLGEKMIPLVAVRSGTVTWGRFDNAGGSILRFRDDDGWEYQYIHLNNDSPGTDNASAACTETFSAHLCSNVVNGRLAKGTRIEEGDVIAYMGDGGNAEGTRPHLHFEIYRPSGSGVTSINPTPSVDAALARVLAGDTRPTPSGPPEPVAPGENGFADHFWFRLHGRYPTAAERAEFNEQISDGLWPVVAEHLNSSNTAATIDRLYLAFFRRYPDVDGINYWVEVVGSGEGLLDVAGWFAESDEFQSRYGGIPFGTFLDRLYLDVLGRTPDEDGKAHWLAELERGEVTRGGIVVNFTESDELVAMTDRRNEIVVLTLVVDGTVPTEDEVQAWVNLRATMSAAEATARWYPS